MSLEIEAAAEQYILQMVRYWEKNYLADGRFRDSGMYSSGEVDTGGMVIPYRVVQSNPDGSMGGYDSPQQYFEETGGAAMLQSSRSYGPDGREGTIGSDIVDRDRYPQSFRYRR